jgi:predicted MFS family arabinose efflux permease
MHGERHAGPGSRADGAWLRQLVIGTTAFLTVVDLFATQAILPMLAAAYRVTPAAMGLAVNACTVGMAVASLAVSALSTRVDRRWGILLSLVLLALPTSLLALRPPLPLFALLRVTQGLCMATAFTLTLAYLGERCSARDAAGAFAAYVTGNVASNLAGRLLAAGVADHLGLPATFLVFAGLNLIGAALVFTTVQAAPRMIAAEPAMRAVSAWAAMLHERAALAAFGIGFCILFAFIGIFTYVNFVLARPPVALGMMQIGLVYFVFLPSILTTPLAGRVTGRLGTRRALWAALLIAAAGLAMLLLPKLATVLGGMTLVAVGLFLAQAIATGFVSRVSPDRAASSGLYLACYFLGGLVGTACLGALFDHFGWAACVAGVAASLAAAACLAAFLTPARTTAAY